jgi:uncharacterized cupin superfamily protein
MGAGVANLPSAVTAAETTAGTAGQVFTGAISASDWVPFNFTENGSKHSYGEMILFRSVGSAGNGLAVGLWRAPDGDTPIYASEAGDETFLVLAGEVTIDFLDSKESKTFKVGDVCAWSQGSRTVWHLSGGFKKFFVTANSAA